ncbi:MAG: 3-isopropylmalate dehydratase [Desulfobacteraceae bacterium]|nr:3-isopropylmalate dehydratase [Desulfobacteraceae bacterium]
MDMTIKGRVWKFDHNVDTDVMAPWTSLGQPWEERRKVILHNRPGFSDQVKPGDFIVAGRNWGCGSSRENAPANLKELGLAAVVAESFGRIYFRNSVAIAFPNIACPGVHEAFEEGDEIELDLNTARVRNMTRSTEIQGQPYTEEMLNIIEKGGLMNVLKERI